jgi:hypothetical protein
MRRQTKITNKELVAVNNSIIENGSIIRLIQPVRLLKISDVFCLVILNKKTRKIYQWDEHTKHWIRSSWYRDKIESSSPLEFLTVTGHTLASTVSKQFGLEVINDS